MKGGGLLDSGEGKVGQTPAAAAAAAAGVTSHLLVTVFFALTIAFAGLVLYVTKKYTHSFVEKLQMLPLCIVAVTPPVLWAIMFRKFHG